MEYKRVHTGEAEDEEDKKPSSSFQPSRQTIIIIIIKYERNVQYWHKCQREYQSRK